MNDLEYEQPSWARDAYGTEATRLVSSLGSTVDYPIEQLVEKFYASLLQIPAGAKVLHHLTDREFGHLRAAQSKYLSDILRPDLGANSHHEMAVHAGLRHAYVGVSAELMMEASSLYKEVVSTLFLSEADQPEVKEIISKRFQFDLISQLEAYAVIQKRRLHAFQQITRQENSSTPLDYIQNTLSTLTSSFSQEVAGLAFGKVVNGNFRYTFAQGRVPYDSQNAQQLIYPTFAAPEILQTCFNEQTLIVNSQDLDATLSAELKQECLRQNIRSFGVFFTRNHQGAPAGCFLVFSGFPGYFLDEATRYYWQQIADQIGNSLELLEKFRGKRRHRLADGLHYRQLLAQGKVEMHYQPIVDPVSGRTVKVEALARLIDGERVLPPGLFLPAFGTNQLRELFEFGLTRIMADMQNSFPPCSINLPSEVMQDSRWLAALPDYLAGQGATPQRISLEILETALSDDPEIRDALVSIRSAGYSILLDDVGAGESSLQRLATLPVTGIKIDQSFVFSLQHGFEGLDLILSLRSLAAQRGLECVAEGVENDNVVDMLGCIGDLLLQGYAFSKPMPARALANWMVRPEEGKPLGPFPKTLYGWYARHIDRFVSIRNALYATPDLVSTESLRDAERCPMHRIIPAIGGDSEIEEAHRHWHGHYARFTDLIKSGASARVLWQDMESCRSELRLLMERKLFGGSH